MQRVHVTTVAREFDDVGLGDFPLKFRSQSDTKVRGGSDNSLMKFHGCSLCGRFSGSRYSDNSGSNQRKLIPAKHRSPASPRTPPRSHLPELWLPSNPMQPRTTNSANK